MIIERSAHGDWTLAFNETEGLILASALRKLEGHYAVKLEDLPEHLRKHWRGRISRDDATAESLSEEAEWLAEERAAWRPQRLVAVQDWLRDYQPGLPWRLSLDDDGMADFLAVLNDRRLLLTLENGIGQDEMDLDIESVSDDRLREALYEIELLAIFQMSCLAVMEGRDASDDEEGLL